MPAPLLDRSTAENAAFLALSAQVGAEPTLIQASGGNTSIKEGDVLWVKASGKMLADAEREDVFVAVDLTGVRDAVERDESDPVTAHVALGSALRPSIETTLHALLPHRVVFHVHSVNAISWAIRADGESLLAERLAGVNWAWVPYRRPGLPLTRQVKAVVSGEPDVLVLGNHGYVVGGTSTAEVESRIADIERRLELAPRPAPKADLPALEKALNGSRYRVAADATAHALAIDRLAFESARTGALYPDHVVFLGAEAAVVGRGNAIGSVVQNFQDRHDDSPAYVIVEGLGVGVREDTPFGVLEMLRCQADVLLRTVPEATLRYLDGGEVAELMNWDAEKYRKTLNR